ncbi:MAG TPA: Fic family protein [Bacteroidia bacterium]
MDLNIHIDIFSDIDRHRDEIQHLNSYDPVTTIIKDKFQLEITQHLASLKAETRTDTKEEILKSATSKGTKIENATEVQKEIYLDIGRKYACTLFMFDMVNKPISPTDIKLFYEILFSETDYRTEEVLIVNQDGEKIQFPAPGKIEQLLSDLTDWYAKGQFDKNIHPLVIISLFHFKFISIHPFLDGNGRVGRLLTNILLMNYGYLPILIEPNDRIEYYEALQSADKGDITPLVKFISSKQLRTLENFKTSPEYLSIVAKFELDQQLKQIKGTEKCFVLTEDSGTNNLLKLVFEASGFNLTETSFISYEGCSKIGSVTLFSIFVKQKLPHIEIVVHRDRDYLPDSEIEKQRETFNKIGIHFFVSKGTDIESHLANAKHINLCHPKLSEQEADEIIKIGIEEIKPKSFELLRKQEFGEKHKDKATNLDIALKEIFEKSVFKFTHGKSLYKSIKRQIREKTKENAKIEVVTNELFIKQLNDIAEKLWTK